MSTLTETPRTIDARELADILGACISRIRAMSVISPSTASPREQGQQRQGGTCGFGVLRRVAHGVLARELARRRPDALKPLDRVNLKDKIVTGDAVFRQKSIAAKIVEDGGDGLVADHGHQRTPRENVEAAFKEPIFAPTN
jgi:hypothetical protein